MPVPKVAVAAMECPAPMPAQGYRMVPGKFSGTLDFYQEEELVGVFVPARMEKSGLPETPATLTSGIKREAKALTPTAA